ncbi:MAG: discoidin domain-containing protein [Sedimentisphaerales bacterium]|nr:discoidin domain-containing protein [Sedimentisphaerales bacterium]
MTHKLLIPCVILALGLCAAQVAQGQLITNLQWRNSAYAGDPQVADEPLNLGQPIFIDRIDVGGRTTRFAVVPEFMVGLDYILMANNDRSSAGFELDITVSRSATIYVFIDNRVGDNNVDNPPNLSGSIMPWVAELGFTNTFEQVGIDEKNQGNIDRWSTIYKLDVPAGTVTLGQQNDGTSRNMYGVAVWAPSPLAHDPKPEDGAVDVPLTALLSWTPGADAVSHDLYFGTVLDDVNNANPANPLNVLVSENQDANTYDPEGLLEFDGTYYWRVDEVAANGTITKGAVWQFSVERTGSPIAPELIVATASSSQGGSGPENTINESGLNENDEHSTAASGMWQTAPGGEEPAWIQYAFDRPYKLHELKVWNYNADLEYIVGFGLKNVTIEYSLDGADWMTLGDVTFAQATSAADYTANTTVDFEGVTAQYVRLVVNSSYGPTGQHGLSEVRFLYVPTYPRQPEPASGATDVDTDVVLNWRAGREAASHDVYLSADEEEVLSGAALVDRVAENRYALSGLDLGASYYWKVGEVNEAEPVAIWEGEVWSFTTQDAYLVDGFETYTDNEEEGLAIWQTWIDGFGTTDNGAQVGHNQLPYAERNIVRQGAQSMPFYYNNSALPRSEAKRTFTTPQDWTRGGAATLMLSFQGSADNTAGQLYVKINDAKVVYDGDASDLSKSFWIPWPIDLAAVGTDLTNVQSLAIGVENGGNGALYFDAIALYRLAPEPAGAEVWIEAEAADTIATPMRIYDDRQDASGGAYIATFGDSSSGNPPDNGVATYTLRLDGGTYRIIGRVIAPSGNDDSFWVRLQGATTNTANHVSGWVQWSLENGENWHDVPVTSMDDDGATVLFTVQPGVYGLEIAFREDGALLDSWIITQELQ